MPAVLDDALTLPSGLVLPNRIAKSAMTENLADADGQATVRHERVYRRWAEGGAGLLISGNLMVDRRYLERSRNIVADDHLDVARLRRVTAATADTPFLAQLSHPGRQCTRWIAWQPVAPSAVPPVRVLWSFGPPRELAADEVRAIIAGFADAARRSQDAGFDGVQLHAAHGYLLAQFLSPATNLRSDEFGGDVEARARVLLEAARAVRAATGDGFTLAVKLNASDFRHGGFTQDDAEQVVTLLAEVGIDLLEVSGGTYESPALFGLAEGQQASNGQAGDGQGDGEAGSAAAGHKEAYFADFARRARRAAPDVPIMLTGGLRTRAAMAALLEGDAVDVVGLARPLALDPDLPTALLKGADGITLPTYRGPKLLSLVGESEWYEAQIGRMGDGEDPDPGLHPVRGALGFITGEVQRGVREGRARRRLARS